MQITDLTRNNIKLLFEIKSKKVITSRSQTIYGGLGFYGASKFLIKHRLINNTGTNKERQNTYMLTEKGNKVVILLEKLSVVLQENLDGVENVKS